MHSLIGTGIVKVASHSVRHWLVTAPTGRKTFNWFRLRAKGEPGKMSTSPHSTRWGSDEQEPIAGNKSRSAERALFLSTHWETHFVPWPNRRKSPLSRWDSRWVYLLADASSMPERATRTLMTTYPAGSALLQFSRCNAHEEEFKLEEDEEEEKNSGAGLSDCWPPRRITSRGSSYRAVCRQLGFCRVVSTWVVLWREEGIGITEGN